MRFLVDAQLPPALAQWIRNRGHEANAVREAGLRDASDAEIWSFAEDGRWIVVTKDEDFAELALRRPNGPQVVWLRIGNCVNRVLLAWFEPIFPGVLNELNAGQPLVELEYEAS